MLTAEGINQSALSVYARMCERGCEFKIQPARLGCGAQVLDCGVKVPGGIAAGLELAQVCLAGKATVKIAAGDRAIWPGAWIQVVTDFPVEACMFGQYAGWPVQYGKFFAMGSGPMRVRRGKEELLTSLGAADSQELAVGTLECDCLPDCQIAESMAAECGVKAANLHLAIAPTRSIAGCVQVVARSVETALHKLHELGFPLASVQSACGIAPLPPSVPDFAQGIGRTNDAILYGAHVSLWVDGDDEQLAEVGPKLPSSHSPDFGEPFVEVFKRCQYDFYRIDPGLFSPAEIVLMNQRSGRSWHFGGLRADLIAQSFGTEHR